ncbi:MAG: tRNA (adenosine(37)-N6)-dimethylallyltransferase MiaA [Desulfomicrobiaceae bacterium]|nr:tRNA (adenosine(37)-N6)-dimethylallyltransferase MiaA [Desulfomicrobiaceae bacterium]
MNRPSVLCVVGATGTGKTAAALALAEALHGAVINVDSRQVYAHIPIVTAQPTAEEQARCPHLLYGYLPLDEPVQAGSFARQLADTVEKVRAMGRLPILVGGTGLYLRAFLHGIAPVPPIPEAVRAAVLARCRAHGSEALHCRLAEVDPVSAARIHPRDSQRICRALEVFDATGEPLSLWHARTRPVALVRGVVLGLAATLPELTPRLAQRIQAMLAAGALEEMAQAWRICPNRSAPGFSGIGCPELLAVLHGEMDLATAQAAWLANTRAYAKRQMTWFRKEKVHWVAPTDHARMVEWARRALEKRE